MQVPSGEQDQARPLRPGPTRRRWRGGDRRAVWRRGVLRRWAAALALGAAGWLMVTALAPPDPPTTVVLLATRDLAVGEPLSADSLRAESVPAEWVPAGALTSTDAVLGRALLAPVRAGEVLTDLRVHADQLAAGLDPGLGLMFVPVADPPAVAAVGAGSRVDLRSGADGAVLAARVLVTSTVPGGSGAPAGLFAAVTEAQAARLAVASNLAVHGAGIAVVIRGTDELGAVTGQ